MYAIAGNHDIVNRNGAIPPQVLFKKFGLKLISPINTNYMHDDVFIAGLPFYPASQNKNLKSKLDELSKKAENHEKSILVLIISVMILVRENSFIQVQLKLGMLVS